MKSSNLQDLISKTIGFIFYRNENIIGQHWLHNIQSTLPELQRIEALVDLDLSSYGASHFKRHAEMVLQNWNKIISYTSSGTGGHVKINVKEKGSADIRIDGRKLQIDIADCHFFLESNFVGFEWLYLTLNLKNEELKSWLFYVNTLQKLPYSVKRLRDKMLKTNIGAELLLDENGLIHEFRYPLQGLVVRRQEDIAEPDWNAKIQSFEIKKPSYQMQDNAQFVLEEAKIDGPSTEIAGVFRIPKKKDASYPAILFISGSGPQDRHGFFGQLDLGTHQILDHLANNGILVLSYDDRGAGETRSKNNHQGEIGLNDLVSDARICLERLLLRQDVLKNRIYIIGHSEGAIIAMILSSIFDVAGIILMAPPFRKIDVLLKEQLTKHFKRSNYTSDQINTQLSELERFIEYVNENRPLDFESPPLFLTNYRSAKWLREHLSLCLSEIVAKVKCPVLIFSGDKDFQLDVEKDGRALAEALTASGNLDVSFRLLKDCDHLFRIEPEEESKPSRYFETNRPISDLLLNCITDWILQTARSSSD